MEGSIPEYKYPRKKYVIDEYLEMRFIALKEIRIETVFDTTMMQLEKLNDCKGLLKS